MSEDNEARVSTNGLRSNVRRGGTYRLRSVALVFVGVVGVVLLTIGQPRRTVSAAPQADKLKDPQFIAEGAKLFATSCGNAYCHGSGGVGGGAPRLRGKGLEAAYLFKTISSGISGTAMLSFKAELSEEQIWKLVAFVMSDVKSTPDAKPETSVADKPSPPLTAPPASGETLASSSMTGSAQAGKALFFDSSQSRSCHHCHSLEGEGTSIGPDLSKVGSRSPRELFLSILFPGELPGKRPRGVKDQRYSTLKLTLRGGDKIVGIKKEEDAESIRIYDTTELPAVLRTIQKTEVVRVESVNESVMPKDYASIYTMKQLLDLVTFLKSAESKSPVVLKDLLE
jgi:putative heme-binding domain-containing protein